jgi:hypothetical protein
MYTFSFLNHIFLFSFFFSRQFNHCLTGNAFYHIQHIITNAICQRLIPQQHNKTKPPMVSQGLHSAAPLLLATSPTSRLLLTACRPTLVLAIAAWHLVSHRALNSALPIIQTQ